MQLFAKNKKKCVQGFILKLVNNNCPELEALIEGPRLEGRVNLVVVTMVIPLEANKPMVQQAFTAVTKEFSTSGVSVVLDQALGFDEVILAFRWEGEMTFVRAKAKHLNPMGGGFYQLGFEMVELVHAADYRELQSVSF